MKPRAGGGGPRDSRPGVAFRGTAANAATCQQPVTDRRRRGRGPTLASIPAMQEIPAEVSPCLRRDADADRELREFLPWGYLVLDEALRVEEINAAAARLLGSPRQRLTGVSLQTLLSEHDVGELLDILAHSRATGTTRDGYVELTARDGGTHHVNVHVLVQGARGTERHRIAMMDVTETRRINEALRRTADEMRDLYQNAPCGYHSLDPEGMVVQINDTELSWLGYAREEIVRKVRLSELMMEHCQDDFKAAFMSLREGAHIRDLQLDLRRKDGSVLPVLLSATALLDANRRFLASRATVFDITRRKLAEEEAARYAQRLKGMSRRAAEAQEVERRALGRELHDRVGQNLTALSINLNILKGALPSTIAPAIRSRLADSIDLVDTTIETMRDVMTELRPAVLDDYGLTAMLRWYADEFTRRTGVAAGVIGQDPEPRLAPTIERALFRIVQESLTNVLKHAGARRVTIQLEPGVGWFCLRVIDDGCGFDVVASDCGTNHHSWGLMIMRERAEAVGGRLCVESATGRGTRVVVEVGRRQ